MKVSRETDRRRGWAPEIWSPADKAVRLAASGLETLTRIPRARYTVLRWHPERGSIGNERISGLFIHLLCPDTGHISQNETGCKTLLCGS